VWVSFSDKKLFDGYLLCRLLLYTAWPFPKLVALPLFADMFFCCFASWSTPRILIFCAPHFNVSRILLFRCAFFLFLCFYHDVLVSPHLSLSRSSCYYECLSMVAICHSLGFGVISNPAVESAFRQVDRSFFVPPVRSIVAALRFSLSVCRSICLPPLVLFLVASCMQSELDLSQDRPLTTFLLF
jgi:hypothetical protein